MLQVHKEGRSLSSFLFRRVAVASPPPLLPAHTPSIRGRETVSVPAAVQRDLVNGSRTASFWVGISGSTRENCIVSNNCLYEVVKFLNEPSNFWASQASNLIFMAIFGFSRQFYMPYKFPEVKGRTCLGIKLQSFMVTTELCFYSCGGVQVCPLLK